VAGEEKDVLLEHLRQSRAAMLEKVDGLSERDMRRPMTPTGTNLLGLVKHLAGLEYSYLGSCFERPAPESLSWEDDGTIWQGADMWATTDESSEYITGLYRRACAHADQTVAELDLDEVGTVSWWREGHQQATLRRLLVRMVGETARHAGHADIIRELVDGSAGGRDQLSDEEWHAYVAKVQAAADAFA
jgi:uncharacterized damage-inducible protein DinB